MAQWFLDVINEDWWVLGISLWLFRSVLRYPQDPVVEKFFVNDHSGAMAHGVPSGTKWHYISLIYSRFSMIFSLNILFLLAMLDYQKQKVLNQPLILGSMLDSLGSSWDFALSSRLPSRSSAGDDALGTPRGSRSRNLRSLFNSLSRLTEMLGSQGLARSLWCWGSEISNIHSFCIHKKVHV